MSNVEYFYDLNYSLANEDTAFERDIVLKNKPTKILSVCGSGSRCFPLLHPEARELHIVDLSVQQIHLAKLREQTIRQLDHEDFLKFWGYAPYKVNDNIKWRKEQYQNFTLGNAERLYLNSLFEKLNWHSPLYYGKWERTFIFFSKIVTKFLGKKTIEKLFSFDDLSAQQLYIDKEFPSLRWMFILTILGNKSMFNALLYKGDFIKKNVSESYISYYSKAFSHLMRECLTKNSFFLQLCFLGEIKYAEGNLIEAKKECFEMMKKSLETCDVYYHQNDLISEIKNHHEIDFISLSDVPSYFSGKLEKEFIQNLKPSLSPKALVVNRNYLRIPDADRSGFRDVANEFVAASRLEGVQMYRIEVLKHE